MKIFVDADACPVKEIIVDIAKNFGLEVYMYFDTSHIYEDGYSHVFTVDKQSDSADFAIINKMTEGDVCVTQDYGLAAMVIGKKCYAINQNGFQYTNDNIDQMLFRRHISKKLRQAGKKTSKIRPRTDDDNRNFRDFFYVFIRDSINGKNV